MGWSVVSADYIIRGSLPGAASVSAVELITIKEALGVIHSYHRNTFLVLTDSLISLQLLHSLYSVHPLVQCVHQSLDSINNQCMVVQFTWVPGHACIAGYE